MSINSVTTSTNGYDASGAFGGSGRGGFGSLTTQERVRPLREEGYQQGINPLKEQSYHQAYIRPQEQGYHQAYGIKPASETDMQTALAFLEAKENGSVEKLASNNFFTNPIGATQAVNKYEAMGSNWEGFNVQAYNGTGELSPVTSGREDAIEGVDWDRFYA